MKLHLLLLSLLFAASTSAQPAPALRTPRSGRFVFTPSATIVADEELLPLAGYASDYLGGKVRQDAVGECAVALILDPGAGGGPEGYRLDIAPDHIVVAGADYGGAFNGLQALFRLLPPEVYRAQGLPAGTSVACTTIEDRPQYAYRGMMLDVARTWMDAPQVKRYINLLSYHNINKLHIHLTDDEGWRLEIKSHPELAEKGGFRGGNSPIAPVYGKWSECYGGYFKQCVMSDLSEYAALRYLEIIPAVDLPGHSRCIGQLHPEIRCAYAPDTVATAGYDYRSAWCVAREENYALLEDILDEICDLFPSEYIHIGGDEVEVSQWRKCPHCRTLMRRLGTDDPHCLQDYFMDRITAILEKRGKRPAVWNEAAASGTFTRRSRVYGWQSIEACRTAADKGYATVVMPSEWFYFDMRQSPHEEGHSWAAIFDARKTYGFNLNEKWFTEEQMHHIEGFEGAFWSEAYVAHEPERPDYLDYMCFPRVCVLARLAWSGCAEGWDTYYKELVGEHYDRLAAMGVRFRLFPPQLRYEDGLFTAATDDGSEIYYTVDDNAPKRYSKPLKSKEPHRLRFYAQYKTGQSPYVADKSYYRTITPSLTLTSSMPESPRAPFSRAAGYRSTSRTLRACRVGDWLLYTFEKPVRCREIFLQTGHLQVHKTNFTAGYAEVSYDGKTFEPVGEMTNGCFTLYPGRPVKAVRLISTAHGNGTPYVTIQSPRIKPQL